MEERRTEEDHVALLEWQLNMVLFEVALEFRLIVSEVAGLEALGIRQVECRPGFHRHIDMGNRALQNQRRGEAVYMRRVVLKLL